jgi:hypothetical protein
MFLQKLGESGNVSNRRAQIMRHLISKCFQFLVDGFELSGAFDHPLFKLFVQFANLFFRALAVGYVAVDFQNRCGSSVLVASQRLATIHDNSCPLMSDMRQLSFPFSALLESNVDGLPGNRKPSL